MISLIRQPYKYYIYNPSKKVPIIVISLRFRVVICMIQFSIKKKLDFFLKNFFLFSNNTD